MNIFQTRRSIPGPRYQNTRVRRRAKTEYARALRCHTTYMRVRYILRRAPSRGDDAEFLLLFYTVLIY